MRRISLVTLSFGLLMLWFLIGCGGATKAPESTAPSTSIINPPTTPTTPPTTTASINVKPTILDLGATQSQQFVATVSNSSKIAVDWSITDCTGDCGSITSDGLYTAPSFVAKATWVRVRATLRGDTNVFGTADLTLQPVSVAVSPSGPVHMATDGTRPFQAAVKYDPADKGVNWSLTGAGCSGAVCGTLTDTTATSVVYHAPAAVPNPPLVTLKANSITDGNQGAMAGIVVAASASQHRLQGTYAFLIQGRRWDANTLDSGEVAMAGHIAIDGNGSVAGLWDATLNASGGVVESISGSYAGEADGNGTLTLNAASGTWSFAVAMQSEDHAALSPDPAQGSPIAGITLQSGYLLRQDANAFSMSSVAGDRVLALTFMNVGAIGRLTSDTAGMVSDGVMDLTWKGGTMHFFTTSTLTGQFSPPDPVTGRGTAALTATPGPDASAETFHFAFYIVSDKKMLLVQSDANTWQWPVLRGEARSQTGAGTFSNASLNAPVIFNLSSDDAGDWWTPIVTLGQIRPDGSGSLLETWDENRQIDNMSSGEQGTRITLNASNLGSYSVANNGRVALVLPGLTRHLYTPDIAVVYLLDNNTGYLIREEVFGTPFGFFEPQSAAPFKAASLAGTFDAGVAGPPRSFKPGRNSGFLILRSDGTAEALLSFDAGPKQGTFYYTGTFTASENGRGVLALSEAETDELKTIVFWAVSPDRLLAIVSMTQGDANPVVMELHRTK